MDTAEVGDVEDTEAAVAAIIHKNDLCDTSMVLAEGKNSMGKNEKGLDKEKRRDPQDVSERHKERIKPNKTNSQGRLQNRVGFGEKTEVNHHDSGNQDSHATAGGPEHEHITAEVGGTSEQMTCNTASSGRQQPRVSVAVFSDTEKNERRVASHKRPEATQQFREKKRLKVTGPVERDKDSLQGRLAQHVRRGERVLQRANSRIRQKVLQIPNRHTHCLLNVLRMGFRNSATAFKAYLRPYLETLKVRYPGITFFSYVDDILMRCQRMKKQEAAQLFKDVKETLKILKLPVKKEKSDFLPHRKLQYLGFVINSRDLTIAISKKKLKGVERQVRRALRQNEMKILKLKHLSTTIGQLLALLPAVPEARLHSRFLYKTQTELVNRKGWALEAIVHLDTEARAELNWWSQNLRTMRLTKLDAHWKTTEISVVATDASQHTIAGVLLTDKSLPMFTCRLSRKERRKGWIKLDGWDLPQAS